jgi:hypothetical protein
MCAVSMPALAQDHSEPLAPVGSAAEEHPYLRIAGFGDFNFQSKTAELESHFHNGGLDLFMTSAFADRFSVLAELVFESDGNALATDLERFQVSYEASPYLRLDLGRVHTPVAYWNNWHHHGAFLQTPIERPAMARFEDEPGLWPVHFVGLLASGRLSERAGLRYEVGVGNGRGAILDEVQIGFDRNGAKAAFLTVGVSPAVGWQISATGYADTIPAVTGELRERDYTLATGYAGRGLEVKAEFSEMRHRPVGGGPSYKTQGYYALISKRLAGRVKDLRPYVLYDRLRPAPDEAFLGQAPEERSFVLGVRFDPRDSVALKAEYRSQRTGAAGREGVVRAQAAIAF